MTSRARGNWKTFLIAALVSALAAVLMVAVGPGFGEPNENAADQATEATTTEEEAVVAETPAPAYTPDPDTTPGGGDDIEENASSVPDSHGHQGSGTGTSTGSQADPGHKEDTNGTTGGSNGPGTGDEPAEECPNEESSVNDNHDDPGTGGANQNPGPYDSTCDGRISQNGQGDDAPGKGTPCAACVGNADDQNPPGQVKEFEGTKANDMGYECDGNQGVGAHYGNGNPAHTGDCGTATPTPTPTPTTSPTTATCPADAEKNAGMPIPEGQTAESYCVIPKCPVDAEKNAGMPIPEGETEESYCNIKIVLICVSDGQGGQVVPIPEEEFNPEIHNEWEPGEVCGPTVPPVKSLDVSANCFTVTATSSHNITNVKVFFVGGGTTESGPLNAKTYSATFTTPIERVVATAGGNQEDEAVVTEDCGTTTTTTTTAPPTTPPPTTPAPSPSTCPTPSDRQGEVPPNGDMTKCDNGNPPTTPPTTPPPTTPAPSPSVCPTPSDRQGQVPPSGDMTKCNNPTPEPTVSPNVDCNGDNDSTNNHTCNPPEACPPGSPMAGQPIPPGGVNACFPTNPPPVCPPGSPMAGQPIPPGGVAACYPPNVCPSNSDMPGQPIPGNPPNVANCYTPEPLCPADSDMPGQPIPGGNILNCYTETPPPTDFCPAGTDLAGLPMPGGDIRNCNEEVLGGVIDGPGNNGPGTGPDVLGTGPAERTGTQGRILPFTGTSIMAYLLIAFELMGAGLLMMRARRRRR